MVHYQRPSKLQLEEVDVIYFLDAQKTLSILRGEIIASDREQTSRQTADTSWFRQVFIRMESHIDGHEVLVTLSWQRCQDGCSISFYRTR